MARAVSEEGGQVRIRPELMEDDRMYHCLVGGRLMLVYRDAQGVTHCYEVEDEALVGAVRSCATYGEAERLLEGVGEGGMNRVINQQDPRGATMSAESDAARVYSEYTSSSGPGEPAPPPAAGGAGEGSCGCGGEAGGTCEDKDGGRPEGERPEGHGAPQGGGEQRPEGERRDGERPEGHGAPQDGGEQRPGDRPEGERREAEPRDRSVVLIGVKPIMTYVTATLTQLATLPKITIKARGKRITQAVDVSQMIVKRMNTVGYEISDVRIASDSFTGEDGKNRKISTMEIDIIKRS